MTKRKASYEQTRALEAGARAWNRQQHRERLAREDDARKAAERAAHLAACGVTRLHGWKNWEYAPDYLTESRVCRDCGATERREVKL
jgi:hypothetical protein